MHPHILINEHIYSPLRAAMMQQIKLRKRKNDLEIKCCNNNTP